jgi:hypothetical protein
VTLPKGYKPPPKSNKKVKPYKHESGYLGHLERLILFVIVTLVVGTILFLTPNPLGDKFKSEPVLGIVLLLICVAITIPMVLRDFFTEKLGCYLAKKQINTDLEKKLKVSSIEAALFVVGIGFMIISFLYSGYLSRGGITCQIYRVCGSAKWNISQYFISYLWIIMFGNFFIVNI